jgi:hypothetical protein
MLYWYENIRGDFMRKYVSVLMLMVFYCVVFNSDIEASDIKKYKRTMYGVVSYSSIEITNSRPDKVLIDFKSQDEQSVYTNDKDYNVFEWIYRKEKENTKLKAVRKDNIIEVVGRFKGIEISKEIKIDNAPWYQSAGTAFSECIKSGDKYKEFWFLNTNNLEHNKMFIKKELEEKIIVNDKDEYAVKVKFSLTGYKSMFWSAYYWFRKSDSVMLKYQGNKGPGTPIMVLELEEE